MYSELGFIYGVGSLQIAPNFLIQKPLEDPLPTVDEALLDENEVFYAGLRPRSYLDSPFAVLSNRETIGAELLLVWDPTPGTWYWMWDNLMREDATLAASLDLVYRHHPTTRDSMVGFLKPVFPFRKVHHPRPEITSRHSPSSHETRRVYAYALRRLYRARRPRDRR